MAQQVKNPTWCSQIAMRDVPRKMQLRILGDMERFAFPGDLGATLVTGIQKTKANAKGDHF